jgi:hypothetical protein
MRKKSARRGSRESGQVIALFAAGLVAIIALAGMAVDVGQLVYTRTDLQKAADAAALAGSQDLPTTSAASSSAGLYVSENGTGMSHTVQFLSTYGANDTIKVTTNKHVNYFFLKVLGMDGQDVSASATVRVGTFQGGSGLVPWGFIASNNSNSKLLQNPCYLGNDANGLPVFKQNTQCTMKYGAGTSSGGDFGALALDATGGSEYRDDIAHGSSKPYKVGDQAEAQTGNMQGPTGQALDERFSMPAPDGCAGNSRDDVLKTNPDGSVSIREGCEESPRIIIIPVVDQINNPQKSTILGFAYMYLTGTSDQGGHTQVKGEFVKFVTEIPGGIYEGWGGGARATTFVE